MLAQDRVADFLARAHGFTNGGNVGVVPSVVVNQSRTVSHTTDLVTIIPPGHDLGIVLGVLTKPIIGLTVVIDDMLASIRKTAGENDRGGRVRIRSDPSAVSDKHQKVDSKRAGYDTLGKVRVDADNGVLG